MYLYCKSSGVDVRNIEARDIIKYALAMLTALFPQETLAVSLFSKSERGRSEKPLLDKGKVAVMEGTY